MTDSIGFIGLGSMGGPIVARLTAWARGSGRHILVHDVRPEAMARAAEAGAEPVAGGARELGARCPLVLACLPAPAISEAVALGEGGVASASGHALRTYVEMSTIGSPAMRCIAEGLATRGVALVDSPISGGAIGAQTGKTLDESVRLVQSMHDAAKRVNPDILVLCHGGPIAEPDDAAYVLANTEGVVGFFGASSMERLPTEVAMTENMRRFKALGHV
jgi:6-phosphogluconate dehydrogenase (decarboxylating)